MPGRAACVSFFRPDDVEVVEGLCPDIMFRQRRIFRMAGRNKARRGMVRSGRLDSIFPMAGVKAFSSPSLGGNTGCARSAVPAQRQPAERMAVRTEGRAAFPLFCRGTEAGPAASSVRSIQPRVPWLGRPQEKGAGWLPCLSPADGTYCTRTRKRVAGSSHAPGCGCRSRISIFLSRQHISGAERASLRLAGPARGYVLATCGGEVARPKHLRRQAGANL